MTAPTLRDSPDRCRDFCATGSIVVRERPDAAKVAHFRQMLRNGSKRPPIKIMKYPDASDGFDRRRWYLYDDHQRLAAARLKARCVSPRWS
jgi:hypothetical protein